MWSLSGEQSIPVIPAVFLLRWYINCKTGPELFLKNGPTDFVRMSKKGCFSLIFSRGNNGSMSGLRISLAILVFITDCLFGFFSALGKYLFYKIKEKPLGRQIREKL